MRSKLFWGGKPGTAPGGVAGESFFKGLDTQAWLAEMFTCVRACVRMCVRLALREEGGLVFSRRILWLERREEALEIGRGAGDRKWRCRCYTR